MTQDYPRKELNSVPSSENTMTQIEIQEETKCESKDNVNDKKQIMLPMEIEDQKVATMRCGYLSTLNESSPKWLFPLLFFLLVFLLVCFTPAVVIYGIGFRAPDIQVVGSHFETLFSQTIPGALDSQYTSKVIINNNSSCRYSNAQ